jgi:hypothetical protein
MKEMLLQKKEELLKELERLRHQLTMYEGAYQYNEVLLKELDKDPASSPS